MQEKIRELENKALWVRRQILETISSAKKGHIGGALSCTDILVALYYGGILRFDPKNPNLDSRDRFILSKGHSCIALFVILADLGFFPLSELGSYCQNGSMLGGHPDRNVPGIEADTGSLGHGLGIAAGLALSFKMDMKDCMSFVLLGDGECYEGSVWEAANFAGHHKLNNLVAIVDRNCQCVTDFTEDCNRLEPFRDKWCAFGWDTVIANGHSLEELLFAFKDLQQHKSEKPLVVITNTVKGRGVSFMEKEIQWHHGLPGDEELEIARRELSLK
jgi:transketolase